MAAPRVLVLRAAGSNCTQETVFAFTSQGAQADVLHVNVLRENPATLKDYQILVIQGGFSYGDDIASGKVLAHELSHIFGQEVKDLVDRGGLAMGICNGFQVLVKSGLLPSPTLSHHDVTLTHNLSHKYEDRWVHLATESDKCVFTQKGEVLEFPVAHAEGRFVAQDETVLEKLKANDQIVFRYVTPTDPNPGYPANPNGSQENVAGICDPTGRILGLMPHPERFLRVQNHPTWTRGTDRTEGDGCRIFRRAVAFFQ